MHTSPELLDQPVERAARVVALDLLDRARAARQRLGHASDAEAIHDFRVAVRRLRSWLRALEAWLDDSTPRKAVRRLEKAARLTSEVRDAEVHLAWLEGQRSALSVRQRRGLTWLVDQLESDKRHGDEIVATKGMRAFDRACETLSRKLRSYRAHLLGESEEAPRRFAPVVAELLRDHVATVRHRLARVETFDDEKGAHAARIAGKRLRYLLEPVAEHVDGGKALVDDLAQLQDVLGDWHDVHVVSAKIVRASEHAAAAEGRRVSEAVVEGDKATHALRANRSSGVRLGLLALAERLHERGQEAFAEASAKWLGPAAGEQLVERVDAVAALLTAQAARSTEIEHKYLLRELPALPDEAAVSEIEQGYIPGKRVLERLRRIQSAGGETRYIRTLKFGDGVIRTEIEDETTPELFEQMWPLTEGRRIHKRRYAITHDRHTWEVDEFLDRELVLAEVELTSPNETVKMPGWLAPVVVRDVTDEREYRNATLASGDGSVPQQVQKDLDQEDRGDGDGDAPRDRARIAKEPVVLPLRRRRRREQPSVDEAPRA
jgi:CHAD domain-containing protein/CYTH domain-containing protein